MLFFDKQFITELSSIGVDPIQKLRVGEGGVGGGEAILPITSLLIRLALQYVNMFILHFYFNVECYC